MRRLRTLLAAWTAAAGLLALAASAHAATDINQYPVSVDSNGQGQLQVDVVGAFTLDDTTFYDPFNDLTGANADAGLNLAVYTVDGSNNPTGATLYGFRGIPFVPLVAPVATTSPPYTLQTVYGAGNWTDPNTCTGTPCLKITELETYTPTTPGASIAYNSVGLEYKIQNAGAQAAHFRITFAADTQPNRSEGGYGDVTGTTGNRLVRTTDWNTGASVALQEANASPWTTYQEDTPFEIWRRIQNPMDSTGLSGTVAAGFRDKGFGVQWDDWRSGAGLAPSSTADVTTSLTYADWTPLDVTGTSYNVPTHTSPSFQVTATQPDGTPADLTNMPLYWKVTGANPQTGGAANGFQQQAPDSAHGSVAHVAWAGTNSGTDYLETFVDVNNNGQLDPGEPDRVLTVDWFDQVQLSLENGYDFQGGSETVDVGIYQTDGSTWIGRPFTYEITGANPTGGFVSNDGTNPQITWTGTNAGTDTVTVCVDLSTPSDSNCTDPGETQTIQVDWQPRLQTNIESKFVNVGSFQQVWVYTYDTFGNFLDGSNICYQVTGPNATGGFVSAGSTTLGNLSWEIQGDGSTGGQSTLTVLWDQNGNCVPDSGELTTTDTFDWVVPLAGRLQLTGNQDGVIGGSESLNASLVDDLGNSEKATIRYSRSGPNPLAETTWPTDGSGNPTPITWASGTAQTGQTDVVDAYADLNNDGIKESNEPSTSFTTYWVNPVDLYVPGYRQLPNTDYADVTLRHLDGTTAGNTTYSYTITGANPASGGGQTDAFGDAYVPLGGTNVGLDHVVVSATIDATPYQSSGDEDVQTVLELYPHRQTVDAGSIASVQPTLNTDYANAPFRVFHWSTTGANPQSGTVVADQYGDVPPVRWTGDNVGTDTLTVWADAPGGTPGAYDPGVDYVNTATVTWQAAQFKLRVDAVDMSVGSTHHATVTVADQNGVGIAGQVVRYWINDNVYPPTGTATPGTDGKLAKVTDANGQIDIPMTATGPGQATITAYLDANDDGMRDPNSGTEPEKSATVTWHPRVETDVSAVSKYEGDTVTVHATFHGTDYSQVLAGQQLKYVIAGPNAVAAPAVVTNSSGTATVTWTGSEPGNDSLIVFQDTNGNDQPDPGELQSPPVTVHWYKTVTAVDVSSAPEPLTVGVDTATVEVHSTDLQGNDLQSAPLRYTITGANPTSTPGSVTTDLGSAGYWYGDVTWQGASGGNDTLTVWRDVNGNGVRDPGEPEDSVTIPWSSKISLGGVSPKFVTNSESIPVTYTGPGTPTIHWTISGPNSTSGSGPYNGTTISWTGNNAGYDYVFAFADLNGNGVWDSGEPSAATTMTWNSLVSVNPPPGTRVAGGQITVPFVLHNAAGNPISGHTLKFKVTGANPQSGNAGGATDSNGAASVTWTSNNYGWDTVTVWDGASASGPAPSDPQGSADVYWAAPPVQIVLNVATPTKYQGNQQSFTVNVSGITIPPAGFTIYWSTSGANSQSGSANTDATGLATFNNVITGGNAGDDTLVVWADVSGASGVEDAFDPQTSALLHWLPLVQLSSATTTQVVGDTHSETVHFVDSNGNPLANTQVIYQITGANPTNGQVIARPIGTDVGSQLLERTDSSGNATVSWVGANPAGGIDTLNVWADRNNNGVVDAGEPNAQKIVTWRTATAAGVPTVTPTATGSQLVPPGSPSDFDGLPTPRPPVLAKTVNATPVSGTVLVKLPAKKKFIPLLDAESIPVGSIVDVTHGRVSLTAAQDAKGDVATADFYLGEFLITQKKAALPITDLKLVGGNFNSCGKVGKKAAVAAGAKKLIRQLWGSGHGKFRSSGRYASAGIRGTTWDVADYCNGTLVKVTQGVVTVHDDVKNKNLVVKAPKTYFAAKR